MVTHKVGSTTDPEFNREGLCRIIEIEGKEIGIYRIDGEYYGMLNYCVHQSGPICEGTLSGKTVAKYDDWIWSYDSEERYVVCPWHGWKFDVKSGQNVNDNRYTIPVYTVAVDDGEIFVEL